MSKKKCCVPGCMESGNSHPTLHNFPNPNKQRERFDQWVISIGGDIIGFDNEDIYKHRSVCHAHFEEKFCCRFGRLNNIAVPTLNLPGPLSLPVFTHVERRQAKWKKNLSSSLASTMPPTSEAGLNESTVFTSLNVGDDSQNVINTEENIGERSLPKYTYDRRPLRPLQSCLTVLPSTSAAPATTTTTEDGVKKEIGQDVILCNVCQTVISTGSVRVVCVTCWDYDVCVSCAASGAHDQHYALRVPATATLEEARAVLQRVRQVLIGENGGMLVKDDDCVLDVKQEKEEDPMQVPDINYNCLDLHDTNDDCLELDDTCESFASAAVEVANQEGESSIESSATDELSVIVLDGQSVIESNTSVKRPILVLDGSGKGDALSNKRSRITQRPQNPTAQDVTYTKISTHVKKYSIAKICHNSPMESGAQVITDIRPIAPERVIKPIAEEKHTNVTCLVQGNTVANIRHIVGENTKHTNVTCLVQGNTVANIRHIVGENTKPVSKRAVTIVNHPLPEKVITNIRPIILKKTFNTEKKLNTNPRPKGPGEISGQMRLEVQLVDLKHDKIKIT